MSLNCFTSTHSSFLSVFLQVFSEILEYGAGEQNLSSSWVFSIIKDKVLDSGYTEFVVQYVDNVRGSYFNWKRLHFDLFAVMNSIFQYYGWCSSQKLTHYKNQRSLQTYLLTVWTDELWQLHSYPKHLNAALWTVLIRNFVFWFTFLFVVFKLIFDSTNKFASVSEFRIFSAWWEQWINQIKIYSAILHESVIFRRLSSFSMITIAIPMLSIQKFYFGYNHAALSPFLIDLLPSLSSYRNLEIKSSSLCQFSKELFCDLLSIRI